MIQIDMKNKKDVLITNKSFHLENGIVILALEVLNYELEGKVITAVFEPRRIETGALEVINGAVQIPVYSNMVDVGTNRIQLNFRWDNKLEQSGKLVWPIDKSLETIGPAQEEIDIISYLIAELKSIELVEVDRVIAEVERERKEVLREQGEADRNTSYTQAEADRNTAYEQAENTRNQNSSVAISDFNTAGQGAINTFNTNNQGAINTFNTNSQEAIDDFVAETERVEAIYPTRLTNVENDLAQHKIGYTEDLQEIESKRQQDNFKVATIEKDLNDYQKVLSQVNVNQEAKQKVTGYETISLPKTSANGQVSASVKGNTLTNLINNGINYSNWIVSGAGSTKGVNGIHLVADSSNDSILMNTTFFKPSTIYTIFINIVAINIDGTFAISSNLTGAGVEIQKTVGIQKIKLTTQSVITLNRLTFSLASNTTNGKYVDFEVYSLVEGDWTNYPITKSMPYGTKSTVCASRLKSVNTDQTKKTEMYISESGHLRSIGSVKDEIRIKSDGSYERIQRISSDGTTVLETPIITPANVSGTLLSYPSGTVYVEPVVADAGLYTDKMTILHSDLPIASIEKVSKVDFTTGKETELNVSQCVIAGDKKSFTHPSLVANDIVFFTYFHSVEGTLGETEITYYDSRHTIKDTANNKFYQWKISSTNGIPSIALVEV